MEGDRLIVPEQTSRDAHTPFCDPRSRFHRWFFLLLLCVVSFGNYFCGDNPSALQAEIEEAMEVDTEEFSELYSWYAWPNVFLPAVGGYLVNA